LKAVVAFARNPRIEGEKLVADLRLLRNSPHYGLIKEMASEAPDQFGVSLAFVNESPRPLMVRITFAPRASLPLI
jgi:hypothetical protein